MNAKSVPLPTPEDLATERLVAAVNNNQHEHNGAQI
jgi:hypothetical protein